MNRNGRPPAWPAHSAGSPLRKSGSSPWQAKGPSHESRSGSPRQIHAGQANRPYETMAGPVQWDNGPYHPKAVILSEAERSEESRFPKSTDRIGQKRDPSSLIPEAFTGIAQSAPQDDIFGHRMRRYQPRELPSSAMLRCGARPRPRRRRGVPAERPPLFAQDDIYTNTGDCQSPLRWRWSSFREILLSEQNIL